MLGVCLCQQLIGSKSVACLGLPLVLGGSVVLEDVVTCNPSGSQWLSSIDAGLFCVSKMVWRRVAVAAGRPVQSFPAGHTTHYLPVAPCCTPHAQANRSSVRETRTWLANIQRASPAELVPVARMFGIQVPASLLSQQPAGRGAGKRGGRGVSGPPRDQAAKQLAELRQQVGAG
jgi:hypothetical protein